ncbi:TetR/AcrR family transcriptional regulator [Actinomadura rupiterrae]|uniref:TetR/AcrR family transcriptional regulator n=1 Tax=Actinomadura rupiterrae TaxID=559627 RepID=UPI0020A407E6|nr:TetR/AcrR family transcriptional regulator [Actinomadura rupiterrae]MCP2337769.1 AcrR family transcriptional regulator [Actinomadura rupiterrae]
MADDQVISSVWARPEKTRNARPTLSREQIVTEAIKLLDAEGVEALSMRKLGQALNAGATSLYRHVANKDELLELVVDEIYGELRVPTLDDPAEWRAAVAGLAQQLRDMILRHPWIAPVLGLVGSTYLGPNVTRMTEEMLGLMESAGFSLAEGNSAVKALSAYVIGFTMSEAAWLLALARTGQSEDEWLEQMRPAMDHAMANNPRLARLFTTQREAHSAQDDPQAEFNYGLALFLNGLNPTQPPT